MNRTIAALKGLLLLVASALHIGRRYNPGGFSILDGLRLKNAGNHEYLVHPGVARFGQIGIWPDKSQIVKRNEQPRSGPGRTRQRISASKTSDMASSKPPTWVPE